MFGYVVVRVNVVVYVRVCMHFFDTDLTLLYMSVRRDKNYVYLSH